MGNKWQGWGGGGGGGRLLRGVELMNGLRNGVEGGCTPSSMKCACRGFITKEVFYRFGL